MVLLSPLLIISTIVLATVAIFSTFILWQDRLRNNDVRNSHYSNAANNLIFNQCNCQVVENCPYYKNRNVNINLIQRCGVDPFSLSIQICCPYMEESILNFQRTSPKSVYPTVALFTTTTSIPTSEETNHGHIHMEDENLPVYNLDIRFQETNKFVPNNIVKESDNETYKDMTIKPEVSVTMHIDNRTSDVSEYENLAALVSQTHSKLKEHKNFNLLPQSLAECGRNEVISFLDIKRRRRRRKRVIGGRATSVESYPWMARLFYENNGECHPKGEMCFGCAGTVLNNKYILTTAHCAQRQSIVVAGDENNMKRFKIIKIIIHPNYNATTKHNDIALLRAEGDILAEDSHPISPVCLPFFDAYGLKMDDEQPSHDNDVFVAGWGVNDIKDVTNLGIKLREAVIPIWPNSECQKIYDKENRNKTIIPSQFCSGEKNADSCWGDSGGGVYTTKSFLQIGIVSFGFPRPYVCGEYPGVNTKVIFYLKWILDSIEQ